MAVIVSPPPPVIFLASDPSAILGACDAPDMYFTYQGICGSSLPGTKFPAADIKWHASRTFMRNV